MHYTHMVKKRTIFTTILEQLSSPDILLLNGPRQVGKTTLLKLLKEYLVNQLHVPETHIHWFDLDRVEDLSIWSNQATVFALLPIKTTERHYIFIDEFQQSKNIGSIVKVLHDHHPQFKIILTGSASWYLNIDESMAGRKRVIPIWPLSFEEFLQWQHPELVSYYSLAKQNSSALTETLCLAVNTAFIEFSTYGGYPAVVESKTAKEKTERLSELINSYLLKDIQHWNYAANTLQVKNVFTLLAHQTGTELSIPTLATNAGLGRTALLNRVELLQQTFMLHVLKPYFTNRTKEIVKQPKVYLVDTGLRNSLAQQFTLQPLTPLFGLVAENTVVSELFKQATITDSIQYWRTKQQQEVDVVIVRSGKPMPIEVKSGIARDIPTNLKHFIRLHAPERAYVLNWSTIRDEEYEGCEILFRPLWFPV